MRYISRRSRDLGFQFAAGLFVTMGSQSSLPHGCESAVCCNLFLRTRLYTRPSTSAAHRKLQRINDLESMLRSWTREGPEYSRHGLQNQLTAS